MTMQYGFVFPGGTARQQLELARIAEDTGWDGVFVWETNFGLDPWSLLSAMAVATRRVRLGTLLTPSPWRRPAKLASQVLTLDQLSAGRAILSVGLGAPDPALGSVGEETDRRVRAERLDESLAVLDAVCGEGPRRFSGAHYQVDLDQDGVWDNVSGHPRPTVWIVGLWGAARSMGRVLRGDGYLPNVAGGPSAEVLPHVADMRAWLDANAPTGRRLDLVCEGQTSAEDAAAAAATVARYGEAGGTWWVENRWGADQHSAETLQGVRRRLLAGPPRPR